MPQKGLLLVATYLLLRETCTCPPYIAIHRKGEALDEYASRQLSETRRFISNMLPTSSYYQTKSRVSGAFVTEQNENTGSPLGRQFAIREACYLVVL